MMLLLHLIDHAQDQDLPFAADHIKDFFQSASLSGDVFTQRFFCCHVRSFQQEGLLVRNAILDKYKLRT